MITARTARTAAELRRELEDAEDRLAELQDEIGDVEREIEELEAELEDREAGEDSESVELDAATRNLVDFINRQAHPDFDVPGCRRKFPNALEMLRSALSELMREAFGDEDHDVLVSTEPRTWDRETDRSHEAQLAREVWRALHRYEQALLMDMRPASAA